MDVRQPTKRYHSNHSLVYSCQYNVIFCPKFRRPVLSAPMAERLKALILEKQDTYGYTVLDMERSLRSLRRQQSRQVMPDHVHLLLDVNPQVGVNTIVGQIKGDTAHVLRQEFPHLTSRLPSLWTRSKFIASVGTVTLGVVKRYIEQQKGA